MTISTGTPTERLHGTVIEGVYLTNGTLLVRVLEILPDGRYLVEDARTEKLRSIAPGRMTCWRRVTPADG